MVLIDRLLKLAGNGDLKLDPSIPTGYVAREAAEGQIGGRCCSES